MLTRSPNPFLPKRKPTAVIRWRTGPSAVSTVVKRVSSHFQVSNDPPSTDFAQRVRQLPKPQKLTTASRTSEDVRTSVYTEIGKLSQRRGHFFVESFSSWGSSLDMIPLAHGPVGCSNYAWTERLNLPNFQQGVESFTALNACTNLEVNDLQDGGDSRLTKAIDEASTLFPLAQGITILNEDPIALMRSNVKQIAGMKTLATDKLIVSLSSESIRKADTRILEKAATIKRARMLRKKHSSTSYDVAIPFQRTAPGLVWIVSKLLSDIGLNPIHQQTATSTFDLARLADCKLIIGLADSLPVSSNYLANGNARLLEQWFGIPLIWTCFLNPASTSASLRAIASQFGPEFEDRAEHVISSGQKKIKWALERYHPQLKDRLLLDLTSMNEARLEPYRLLGMRIGNWRGWQGKRGVARTPRLVLDREHPNDRAINSYLAEAKPDLVLYFRRSEMDWRKLGQGNLPFTPFFNHDSDSYWGYDGFVMLAAALDRVVNAPWRKLVKPPW